ncbi:unnamed protein product [Cladocopium goreaui]|uniref:Uncharacterized protein n=1 Tax=Cladocopium goreaui TaxID=2562237 RepID=A0A9P1DT69_9DINO|nr:unnamed protein product [Cladocopium goreaui]
MSLVSGCKRCSPGSWPQEDEPPAPTEALEEQEEEPKERKAWVYGINNHVERLDTEVVQARDVRPFVAAVTCAKITRCCAIDWPAATQELTLQSCLLDRASMLMLQVVLPYALHLSSLRLSACALDVELLTLLRQALGADSSVQTLHVEWNRVELPMEDSSKSSIKDAHHWSEIDEAERKLEQRKSQRYLLTFRDELEMLQGGTIAEAVQQLAEKVVPGRATSAVRWPMDLQTWISIFYDTFHMDVLDCEPIFHILDSDHGAGDGLVPLVKLQEVLQGLPRQEASTEERLLPPLQPPECTDDIGSSFAAFLDKTSPLEMLSFRCCNLSRLEVQAISSALASPSPHLRALNLWGNKICDHSTKYLAEALEFNFGLQFLGLGRNFVTHVGLQTLCQVLGVTHVTDKAVGDKIMKHLKDQRKEFDKKKKAFGAAPKDGNGRERYWPSPHLDTCEEQKDEAGASFWLWRRNTELQTLNLEDNPINDADAVEALQPFGISVAPLCGDRCNVLVLWNMFHFPNILGMSSSQLGIPTIGNISMAHLPAINGIPSGYVKIAMERSTIFNGKIH